MIYYLITIEEEAGSLHCQLNHLACPVLGPTPIPKTEYQILNSASPAVEPIAVDLITGCNSPAVLAVADSGMVAILLPVIHAGLSLALLLSYLGSLSSDSIEQMIVLIDWKVPLVDVQFEVLVTIRAAEEDETSSTTRVRATAEVAKEEGSVHFEERAILGLDLKLSSYLRRYYNSNY